MRSDERGAMRKRATLAMGLTIAMFVLPSIGHAQSEEADQKQACMGDAFRYCASSIPDRQLVGRCLVSNRDQLTQACRTMIDGGKPARAKKG